MMISIVDEIEVNSIENEMISVEIEAAIIETAVGVVNGMMEGKIQSIFIFFFGTILHFNHPS